MSDLIEHADDVCALPLVRRMAALLDRDPRSFAEGDPLPRGWHVAVFNPPTPQAQLRADGAAHLGVTLPDLGMPRLMMGGRRIEFFGHIPIGTHLRRSSRSGAVTEKSGKSGRFALVDVEHRICVGQSETAVVIETISYILREAKSEGAGARVAKLPSLSATQTTIAAAEFSKTLVPDETLLFRYSAITDNPHRIHYDLPYALSEGYPALVVNGTVPSMFMLEMFREHVGGEPAGWHSRNKAPIFGGEPLTLTLTKEGHEWLLLACGPLGEVAIEARAWL